MLFIYKIKSRNIAYTYIYFYVVFVIDVTKTKYIYIAKLIISDLGFSLIISHSFFYCLLNTKTALKN